MPTPALKKQGCEVCDKTENLLRCSGCQLVYYCTRDHFLENQPQHKKHCTPVKKARKRYEKEEQDLKDAPADIFLPAKVFETCVGSFWGIMETRPYMRARNDLAHTMLVELGASDDRPDVITAALDHFLDMLRLCRIDNIGVRHVVPALYVRLNRDQEAYDFMKWWATTGVSSDYEWDNMDLPHLDVKGADVLESVDGLWSDKHLTIGHGSIAFLIKERLRSDVRAIADIKAQNADKSPEETLQVIRKQMPDSLAASRPDILAGDPSSAEELVQKLKGQMKQVFGAVHAHNPHHWPCMMENPRGKRIYTAYKQRGKEEAELVIEYNSGAWLVTPGSLDAVKELMPKE